MLKTGKKTTNISKKPGENRQNNPQNVKMFKNRDKP